MVMVAICVGVIVLFLILFLICLNKKIKNENEMLKRREEIQHQVDLDTNFARFKYSDKTN